MTFVTRDSRVADIIYSFLNCVIFLNIYSVLFYLFFLSAKNQKNSIYIPPDH
jgi:hypothetical protein